ncbi:unnamed protein product, partial [Sphacelaria rigidula]
FPLTALQTSIDELCSIMKFFAILIKEYQQTDVPTGLASYLSLVALRANTLDPRKPLQIHAPRRATAGNSNAASPPPTRSMCREAVALQPVSGTTRRMLGEALDKRFFTTRYGPMASSRRPDYVFEMTACIHPYLVLMTFLQRLCPGRADSVKKAVEDKVLDLMTTMAEGAALEGGNGDAGSSGVAPPNRRKKTGGYNMVAAMSEKAAEKEAQHLLDAGIFDEMDAKPDVPLTMRQLCKEEFDAFVKAGNKETLRTRPVSLMHNYWASEGSQKFLNTARAARVLLSVPASSAVLERDFSTAGRLITASRSRIDSTYVQMVLFLNGSRDVIPDETPVLSDTQSRVAIPRRL